MALFILRFWQIAQCNKCQIFISNVQGLSFHHLIFFLMNVGLTKLKKITKKTCNDKSFKEFIILIFLGNGIFACPFYIKIFGHCFQFSCLFVFRTLIVSWLSIGYRIWTVLWVICQERLLGNQNAWWVILNKTLWERHV